MKRIRVMLFVLSVSFFAAAARGQVATGTPLYGSFSGGPFDTIDNGNLNVHFSIPVENKAGRGLPFNYNLTYDTSVWYPAGSSGMQVWQPVTNWGWSTWTAAQTGYVYYNQNTNYCYYYTGYTYVWVPYEVIFHNFIYYDSGGTPHPFPGETDYWSNPGGGCPSGTNSYDNGAIATDDSGYVFNGQNWNLTSRQGQTITPPYQQALGAGSTSDANGNTISNTNTGVYTDTLRVTALTVTGNGTPSSPVTFQYTGAGGSATVKMNFTAMTVQTAFGCGSIAEFGPTAENLVTEIDMPGINSNPSDKYTFSYEQTPNDTHNPHYVTGRLVSVTLPTGGTISYTYSGGANGITCNSGSSDGTAATLTRTTPDGTWTYAHTENSSGAWTTDITAPADAQGNQAYTAMNFQGIYETERQVYATNGGPQLLDVTTCYGTPTSYTPGICNNVAVYPPVTDRTVLTTPYTNGSPGSMAEVVQLFSNYASYSLPYEIDEYDWGPALSRKTITTYDYDTSCGVSSGSIIVGKPCSVTIQNSSGGTVSSISYTYDSNGNLLKETPQVGPQLQFSYNTNGTLKTSNDGAGTTNYYYNSGSCNAFPYSISPPAGPSASLSWDCNGAVVTSVNTGNGAATYGYDNMNRVTSVNDPNVATTSISYTPTSAESTLTFNSGSSTVDLLTTLDGLGRSHISQRKQSPSGAYDSTVTAYDALGRPSEVSVPYSASGGAGYTCGSCTTTHYDAMSRVSTITDPDGGTLSFTYSANDVLRTLSPAPSGENTKSAQYQYDGLGRLTSVCEITGASGSGACSQNTAATGFFTSYTYNALNELTGVSQSGQTRSYGFDPLGRLTSEANPEAGTTYYYYDSDSTCGNSPGDMVKKVDALINVTCFHYDAIHRLTSITYPSGSYSGSTPKKVFVYDSATVNGNGMQNTAGRLAEAYTCTGSCSAKITDLGFSYDADGNVTQVWESTPHSNGYYEVTAATYWPNGLPETLQLLNNGGGALIPQISYNPDGEGRISTVGATGTGQQNPVTSTSYNLYASPPNLQVTLGSGDSDLFKYDANTGRMTQYNFNVNGKTVTANLGWNANGTLATLGIIDPFSSADTQTCKFGDPNALPPVPGYDDLGRLINVNCGSAWKQSFSADAFGNLTKTGLGGAAESFQPTYNLSNHVSLLGSQTPTYDADGNSTNDTVNSYNWDSDGNMISATTPSATTSVTYDAMDRALEFSVGSSYTEVVYGPGGGKLALMSGQTLTKAFVPLSGGATAVYTWNGSSTVLGYYRHADWLGSSRFASLPSGTNRLYYDGAYAPYGENYAETGTTDRSFTGQNQDMVSSGSYPLYDFLMREYNATWGRWISPDPAGLAAVDMTNPQTWNRYAYVLNDPLALIDPQGLDGYASGPPCGGYDQISCQQYFQITGPGLGWCPPMFDQCYATLGGTTIGVEGSMGIAFLQNVPLNTVGQPCNAQVIADNECAGGLGTVLVGVGTVLQQPPGQPPIFTPGPSSRARSGASIRAASPKPQPRRQKVTASCMASRLIDNFVGPGGSAALTTALNVVGVAVVRPAVAASLPGPGWLYTATAVVYDLGMIGKSYVECRNGGEAIETPASGQPEE